MGVSVHSLGNGATLATVMCIDVAGYHARIARAPRRVVSAKHLLRMAMPVRLDGPRTYCL